jgi:hypothetical protein
LLFGFLTSFFAPCREAAMTHHLLLREFLLIPTSNVARIFLSAFHRSVPIFSGFYSIFIEFTLPFLLGLFLFCEFFLTLLKTKVRFSHWMPPQKKIIELHLDEGGPDDRQPASLPLP